MRQVLFFLTFLALMIVNVFTHAQPTTHRCYTDQYVQKAIQQNPKLQRSLDEARRQIQQYLRQHPQNQRTGVITIPVHVIVVHNGESVGVGANISMAQIQSQIDILNEDYRRLNADAGNTPSVWQGIAADAGIEFCLATRDPNGNPTNGVTRINGGSNSYTDSYIDNTIKPATIWNRNKYLNIWVANIQGGILGYATFPGWGNANQDGVVITTSAFGNTGTATYPYNKGRTATHEVGHWLGLYHIWGNSGGCSDDDGINDTPLQSAPYYGCPSYPQSSCSSNDMFMNYMDYTDDRCMNLFTAGQAAVMNSVLNSTRSGLLTSNGCAGSASTPNANFSATPTTGCPGTTVTFTDQSTGNPTSWSWSFPGGNPSSSSAQNPTVTYNTPGTYNVTLTVSNANGSDTETKSNYITINAATNNLPLTQGFQNATFPPSGWQVLDQDNDAYTWARTTAAGGYGNSTASAYMDNYSSNNSIAGTQDWLITPAYDFSAVSNAVMTFDVAYARYNNNLSDTLGLYYSTDCGATFHQLWRKGGSQLATAPDNTNAFVPTASQWRTETVNLSLLNGEDYVQFAFINFSGWGNNLYLDNINIPAPTSNAPIAEFTANTTTIPAGGSVNFTDLSLNNPTSWSWTFQGGTPGTSNQQNPSGIVYNTPGTYTVSLTVSNAYGSDTETKTNYITVTQGTSATCDTLSNIDAGDNLVIYLSDNWGYVAGHNGYGDLGKADYFSNAPSGYEVTGVLLGFARAAYGSPSSAIQVHVWDNSGPGGAPGNSLASENLLISTIAQDVSNGAFTWVSFSNPPVISGPFYVGITFDYSNPLDTVALITNTDGETNPGTAWELWNTGTWYPYSDATNSWGLNVSHAIFPEVCPPSSNRPVANFTASATAVCAGESITFNDASSGNPASWYWYLPGGTPASSTNQNVTVTYNNPGSYSVGLVATNAYGSDTLLLNNYITVHATPSGTASVQHVSCHGGNNGAIAINMTGGAPPFTYNWSNGQSGSIATNLAAGTYSVTVTDNNGCSISATINVNQPAQLNLSVNKTDETCPGANDGTATATVTGGTPPYTYQWSTGAQTASITGLPSGTYFLTVTDAKGCVTTTSVAINHATGVAISVTSQDAGCGLNDGAASVTVITGVAPFQYLWSNGNTTTSISNLSAGAYGVTVTDANGCTASQTAIINNTGGPSIQIDSRNDVSCNGGNDGSVTVSATGGTPPYQFSWFNGNTSTSVSGLAAGSYLVSVTDNAGCISSLSVTIQEPAPISGNIITTPENCNGSDGTATVNVTGGTPGYTYSWSNGMTGFSISGLATGTYIVTITDGNGCTVALQATVPANNGPAITVTVTDASCNGASDGAASVLVNSGNPPYSFSWSNGMTGQNITGLSAGGYSVTVTDSTGCTVSQSINISEPPAITIQGTVADASCGSNNGSIDITVSGGNGSPYGFQWSNGSTAEDAGNLFSGQYTVTVTDIDGCTATRSFFVNDVGGPAVSATVSDVTCHGFADGSITVSATGSPPFTYSLNGSPFQSNPVFDNLSAGIYTLTTRDFNNCITTISVTVNQPDPLQLITGSSASSQSANNGMAWVTVSGGTPPYDYQWDDPLQQTSDTARNLAAGIYHVTVSDANGCTAVASDTVDISNGLNQLTQKPGIQLYPNPATDKLVVVITNHPTTPVQLTILDMNGRESINRTFEPGNTASFMTQIDIRNLTAGVYFVHVFNQGYNSIRKLVIIK